MSKSSLRTGQRLLHCNQPRYQSLQVSEHSLSGDDTQEQYTLTALSSAPIKMLADAPRPSTRLAAHGELPGVYEEDHRQRRKNNHNPTWGRDAVSRHREGQSDRKASE
eukprot:754936-Hanusia_phi.AAC.3